MTLYELSYHRRFTFCSPLIYGPSSPFNAVVGFGLIYSRANHHRTSSRCCPSISNYSRGIFKVPHHSQRRTLTCKQPPAPLIRPKLDERRQVHADREHDRTGAWQKQRRLSLDAQTHSPLGSGFGRAGLWAAPSMSSSDRMCLLPMYDESG